ncbi:hypothetical protein B566_EDAN017330 [Ephemera danica]|nr:hypothetical protein B566_EDAN017330 [Ephemera danica]
MPKANGKYRTAERRKKKRISHGLAEYNNRRKEAKKSRQQQTANLSDEVLLDHLDSLPVISMDDSVDECIDMGETSNTQDQTNDVNYTTSTPYQAPRNDQLGQDSGFDSTFNSTASIDAPLNTSSSPACVITTPKKKRRAGNRTTPAIEITGRRIFEPIFFLTTLFALKDHSPFCTLNDLELISENREGFRSVFNFQCKMCNGKYPVATENTTDRTKLDVNTSIVHGTMVAGGGLATINEIAMSLNMPSMGPNTYQKVAVALSSVLQTIAKQVMQAAAAVEKNYAAAMGKITSDLKAKITVIADGCWPKRSYKTNYSSLSGVATIIGAYTKKVLYYGVKNKYCSICAQAKKKDMDPPTHKCYKNWGSNQSSTSMEAAVVSEGFCSSEAEYGLIYDQLIADGDSSVYKKIRDAKPYKDTIVEKIECRNHLLRNFDSKLRNIASSSGRMQETGLFRKFINENRLRMRIAISCAIKYRKDEQSITMGEKIKNLKNDIMNMPYHVCGQHDNCHTYFCKGIKDGEINYVPRMKNTVVWEELMAATKKLSFEARSLIQDVDNNIVESFNNGVCKVIGGKRTNFTMRGDFQSRCAIAVISHNDGRNHYLLHKAMCEENSPGMHTKRMEQAKIKINRRQKAESSRARRPLGVSRSARFENDPDYGENAQQPDMPENIYNEEREKFLQSLMKSPEEIVDIERRTVLQRDSHEWVQLHQYLFTASSFHRVKARRQSTSCAKIANDVLYGDFDTAAMQYGRENEDQVRDLLSIFLDVEIQECGIFIHPEHNFLAASPDGLIGDDTLVEIKCSFSAAGLNLSPEEAVKNKKTSFWKLDKVTGDYIVNKNDKWYTQIQGQLNITGREKCIFAYYTPVEPYFKIEIIHRDRDFWEILLPQLVKFYMECLLPEIIDPRKKRSMPLREPCCTT